MYAYELRVCSYILAGIAVVWWIVLLFGQPWAVGYAGNFTLVSLLTFVASVSFKERSGRGGRR